MKTFTRAKKLNVYGKTSVDTSAMYYNIFTESRTYRVNFIHRYFHKLKKNNKLLKRKSHVKHNSNSLPRKLVKYSTTQ